MNGHELALPQPHGAMVTNAFEDHFHLNDNHSYRIITLPIALIALLENFLLDQRVLSSADWRLFFNIKKKTK
jgi:hypothetical protein